MSVFQFKQFQVRQERSAMKVNSDSILLGAWVNMAGHRWILDIGTGTGLLALMAAQRNQQAIIYGVEIEEDAFAEATLNFALSPWSDRLYAFWEAVQDFDVNEGEYDLILCNPPFFTGGTLSQNENKAFVRHTIKLPNNELLIAARRLLKQNGIFAVVLPFFEGLRFIELAAAYGFFLKRKAEMRPRADRDVERLLLEFARHPVAAIEEETIVMYRPLPSDDYTDQYIRLTKDFYLKM